jgi:hypothetical protein
MDPNSIFSLFDSEPENSEVEPEKEIKDLPNHPYVLLGLFTRMVLRGEEAIHNSVDFLKALNPDIDLESISEINRYMLYLSGFNYLSKLSLEDPFHQDVLLEKAGADFLTACRKSIQFFQEREDYEKCASVKKYSDFINFSKNKLPL